MKKIIMWTGLIIAFVMAFVVITKVIDYNSISNKNTRELEQILSQDITSDNRIVSGSVKGLITFDYDRMIVFEPYQPLELMEEQIGFKYSKLEEGVSEGMMNILFVKGNNAIAYLVRYTDKTGCYIDIPAGDYTKAQIDKMTYTREEKEVGNSAGTQRIYMYYKFKS